MTTHGTREDFNQEVPGKEKEKEDKGKEKDNKQSRTNEKEKERTTLQEMRVFGLKITGKEQRQKVGMMAIGPMKMRQRGNPKARVNGKKITTVRMDITKEGEERKERTRKERPRT